MNKSSFYILSLLGALLITVVSCKKEDVGVPTPEKCPKIGFDVISINESFLSTTYGSAFYAHNSVTMQGKYTDYSGLVANLGSARTISAATLPGSTVNFSDKVLNIKDADVMFDYSSVNHLTRLKSISLGINNSLNAANLKINGGSPQGYILSEYLGQVELVGDIYSIELGGENISIDNVDLNDFAPIDAIGGDASTFSFDAPSNPSDANTFVDTVDTNYTLLYRKGIRLLNQQHLPYPTNIDSIDFRVKYVDYHSNPKGLVQWGGTSSFDYEKNSNFSGGILKLIDCDLEVDFSNISAVDKHISFDISNSYDESPVMTNPNEFEVNGAPLSTVPAGVSYTIMPLENAENGDPCYRVVIEGPINTIVLKGDNRVYDNLFVHGF